jgi:phage-related protein
VASDVKVTISGDSSSLEKAFSNVGASAKKMGGDLDQADAGAKGLSSSMSGVGAAVDSSESKFMGTADVLDGLNSVMGTNFESQINMARGFGDIAGGLTNLGPLFTGVLSKLGLMTGATAAQAGATGAATTAQSGLNLALLANPIGLVVAAIVALVAIFVVAYHKSDWFRGVVTGAFDKIKGAAVAVWDFLRSLPDKIGSLGQTLVNILTWPYRTAFNAIARLWNNTVGKLAFSVPDWVPAIGGKGFSMPRLPEFHAGGVVPGRPGSQMPIMAMAGETVLPPGRGAAGPEVIQLVVDGRVLAEVVRDRLLQKQRTTPLGFVS